MSVYSIPTMFLAYLALKAKGSMVGQFTNAMSEGGSWADPLNELFNQRYSEIVAVRNARHDQLHKMGRCTWKTCKDGVMLGHDAKTKRNTWIMICSEVFPALHYTVAEKALEDMSAAWNAYSVEQALRKWGWTSVPPPGLITLARACTSLPELALLVTLRNEAKSVMNEHFRIEEQKNQLNLAKSKVVLRYQGPRLAGDPRAGT